MLESSLRERLGATLESQCCCQLDNKDFYWLKPMSPAVFSVGYLTAFLEVPLRS